MKTKKLLYCVLGVLLAAVIGGCLYLNTLMPIITGYAAKNLASDVFVSGREPALTPLQTCSPVRVMTARKSTSSPPKASWL